jgi:hypothetical protein
MKNIKLLIKENKISALTALAAVLFITTFLLAFYFQSGRAVITDREENIYTVRSAAVICGAVIARTSPEPFKSKNDALAYSEDVWSFRFFKLNTVEKIEFIQDGDDAEVEPAVRPEYTGTYKIKVSGHNGFLYIVYRDNKLIGSVRFPGWAKGVYEPLKYLKITGSTISFTRSVTTPAEQKRVGAHVYYTQRYTGIYSMNGRLIKGQYDSGGTRNPWEGVK